MMTVEYLTGVIVGVVTVIVIFAVCRALFRKVKSHPEIKGSARYDERQLIAQGVAYKWAFWTMVIYDGMFATLGAYMAKLDNVTFFKSPINGLLGIFLAVSVYGVICVVKDAYMSIYDNVKSTSAALLLIGTVNLIPGLCGVFGEGLVVDGEWNLNVLNLYAAVAMYVVQIAFLVKVAWNKKNEVDDEE